MIWNYSFTSTGKLHDKSKKLRNNSIYIAFEEMRVSIGHLTGYHARLRYGRLLIRFPIMTNGRLGN